MLKPSTHASDAVLSWLEAQGLPSEDIQNDGDWITFHATTSEAERILDTKFHYYTSAANSLVAIRTLQYSIPQNLHQYIHMIQPTTRFGQIRPERSTILEHFRMGPARNGFPHRYRGEGLNVTFCNSTITPQCLRALYNVGNFRGSERNGGKMGVTGFLNNYAKFKDLAIFTQQYAPYAKGINFTYELINGGLATQDDTVDNDIEANLDAQYAYTLAYPTPGYFYSTAGKGELVPDLNHPNQTSNQNEPYLDFLHYILSLPDDQLPTTLSTSYGEDEQSVPAPCESPTPCNKDKIKCTICSYMPQMRI